MAWENILKQAPTFNSIQQLINWMVSNNAHPNAQELQQIFQREVMSKVQYGDPEMQQIVTNHAVKTLEPYTNHVTRNMGLRDQWARLLQEGKIMD